MRLVLSRGHRQIDDYWLPGETGRHAIASAGQCRRRAEHTYRHRLELLRATLGGPAQGYPAPTIHNKVDHGASA